MFRKTGLPLGDVQDLLCDRVAPSVKILEKHLQDIEDQILSLKGRQHSIITMLKEMTSNAYGPIVDKQMWVKMMEAAGMDESSMTRWHAEFESRAPKAHNEFLLSLGISEEEARQIREWSRGIENEGRDDTSEPHGNWIDQ